MVYLKVSAFLSCIYLSFKISIFFWINLNKSTAVTCQIHCFLIVFFFKAGVPKMNSLAAAVFVFRTTGSATNGMIVPTTATNKDVRSLLLF